MAKQRKTRKEKFQHDRRQSIPSENTSVAIQDSKNFTFSTPSVSTSKTQTVPTNEYNYLKHDLLKTSFLTISILVVEIILAFVFKI